MPTEQKSFERIIKLPPALGDWTQLEPHHKDENQVKIGDLKGLNFDRLPEETLKKTHFYHYRFAESLVKNISSDLSIRIILHQVQARQVAYHDFIREHQGQIIQIDAVYGQEQRISFFLDLRLAESLCNRAFGGKGESGNGDTLSTLEEKALQAVLADRLAEIKSIWLEALPGTKPQELQVRSGLEIDRTITRNEAYIYFTYLLSVGEGEPRPMLIGYSHRFLKQLLEKRLNLPDKNPQRVVLKEETLKKVKIQVRFILGKTILSMKEIQSMNIGDVLTLEQPLDKPVSVVMSDRVTIPAQPGQVGNQLAIQLLTNLDQLLPRTVGKAPVTVAAKPDKGDAGSSTGVTEFPVPPKPVITTQPSVAQKTLPNNPPVKDEFDDLDDDLDDNDTEDNLFDDDIKWDDEK